MRVLDIDLDFFLYRTAYSFDVDGGRLDPNDFPPWSIEDSLAFLTEKCGLSRKLPGYVAEFHDEVFYWWGEAIESGRMSAPLDVVHVDAHADLGIGDSGFMYLMGELAFAPIEGRYEILKERKLPTREQRLELSNRSLNDGNWLMFAIACGWIENLTYVSNSSGKTTQGARLIDVPKYLLRDFDLNATELQIVATYDRSFGIDFPCAVDGADPPLPFRAKTFGEFRTSRPFDMVFLTRSPDYTPAEADPTFDAIREAFIGEW